MSIAISAVRFVFAKILYKGSDSLFFIYIILIILPFQAKLLINYIQLRDFNMLNTTLSLTVPMVFSPFAVFLFRQFIKIIQNELIDYTMLETSPVFKMLRYVVIPLIKPAIVSSAILIFCEGWNMVEQAMICSIESTDIYPLLAVLCDLHSDVSYTDGAEYIFPIIMLFILFCDSL